jgi:hypothetical protein
MSIDPKKFGLSDSLVNAVNEALKGSQHKLDVAEPKGKLTSADFKKLRGEGAKPDYIDLDKDGNKKEPMKQAAQQVKEVSDAAKKILGDKAKEHGGKVPFTSTTYKDGKKVVTRGHNDEKGNRVVTSVKNEEVEVTEDDKHFAQQSKKMQDAINMHLRRGKTYKDAVDAAKKHVKEGVEVTEADDTVMKQIAAKKDAMKKQIQQKIAQKQMQVMQAKANKRISDIKASNDKCTCDSTNESKMKCEVHGGNHGKLKGGKEPIEVNPPLKEASNLPKSVISKGHEIAKSLIKHRAKVREPYAVGMAQAKKSAGIKEDAEQVDEISKMKAIRTAVKRQTAAHGAAIERGDEMSDKEQSKVNKSQALIKKKYGEKGDKIVHKAVGKRIGYQD